MSAPSLLSSIMCAIVLPRQTETGSWVGVGQPGLGWPGLGWAGGPTITNCKGERLT